MIVTLYLVGSTVEKYGVQVGPLPAARGNTGTLYCPVFALFQLCIGCIKGVFCP